MGGDTTSDVSSGSSPLARGLLWASRSRRKSPGIIPARAGFTYPSRSPSYSRQDHPRSRGVYPRVDPYGDAAHGSSPLARGLLRRDGDGHDHVRIIPARAGFTVSGDDFPSSRADHPRSRGVYSSSSSSNHIKNGSSPLARGLPHVPLGLAVSHGIIPARAGFTRVLGGIAPGTLDHPRSRGVYFEPPDGGVDTAGSSPLARGLRIGRVGPGLGRRIIPARAGFTSARSTSPRAGKDHPRSRGVYNAEAAALCAQLGSSPLARGLREVRTIGLRDDGIIPARAGFTSPPSTWTPGSSDHPRSRGVYTSL